MTETEARATLGLQSDATEAEIRRAYRKAAAAAHPDREGGNHERMQRVNEAYAKLTADPIAERQALIERQAGELLVAVFGAALDADEEPIAYARQRIDQTGEKLRQHRISLNAKEAALTRRSGKSTVKSGTNLVQSMIESRLAALARERKQLDEACDSNAEARRLLALYEGETPPAQVVGTVTPWASYAMHGNQQHDMAAFMAAMQRGAGI